jgi:EVE domain
MKHWIAVASAEHVRRGQAEGFMQVCHGKAAPLKRIQPGDWVAYYSPTETFKGKDKLQAFTAVGRVKDKAPYLFDMGNGFCPARRDMNWLPSRPTAIAPLLQRLDFSKCRKNWGYQLRFGLFEVSMADMHLIAAEMKGLTT